MIANNTQWNQMCRPHMCHNRKRAIWKTYDRKCEQKGCDCKCADRTVPVKGISSGVSSRARAKDWSLEQGPIARWSQQALQDTVAIGVPSKDRERGYGVYWEITAGVFMRFTGDHASKTRRTRAKQNVIRFVINGDISLEKLSSIDYILYTYISNVVWQNGFLKSPKKNVLYKFGVLLHTYCILWKRIYYVTHTSR